MTTLNPSSVAATETKKATEPKAKKAKPAAPRVLSAPNAFGKFCKIVRVKAELTAPEWAKRLETSTQTVNQYELGDKRALDVVFLQKVANLVAEVSPEDLAQFNKEFVLGQGIVFIHNLTEEQKALIAGVIDGTVQVAKPAEVAVTAEA